MTVNKAITIDEIHTHLKARDHHYPVHLMITEPPTPPGYIIKQDGIFGEWTVIRDNDLGEIIACGCETRAEAVRLAKVYDL